MHDRAEQLDDVDRDTAHEAVARQVPRTRSRRQLRQPGARSRRLERTCRRSVAGCRCDRACKATDGGRARLPAGGSHQPGDCLLATGGVMEEADDLERTAEWRMRKVDADPGDATSRTAAALL